jgi:major membrane immunogen (membrane-anchored lipoprotein)
MKKITLVAALVIGLFVTSCSKSDDNSPSVDGKWNYNKVGFYENSQESLSDYSLNISGCGKNYMQLTTDGVMIYGKYNSQESPCQELKTNGTYTLKDSKISLNNVGGTQNYDVVLLTNTELKLRASNGETILFSRN